MSAAWKFCRSIYTSIRVLYFRVQRDDCFLRASALTYQTVLSLVPVLAVMFGIAKGFGVESILETTLLEEFHDQQEVFTYLIHFGYKLLEETRGSLIAGVGIITLLFTVMRLLANIETSLNIIWDRHNGRPLSRKLSDFLALILVCPIIFILSSSITLFVTTQLEKFGQESDQANIIISNIGPYALWLIPVIPYVMSSVLFTFLYVVMPYTEIRFRSNLLAGILAGCAFQILQMFYIQVQIQISQLGAIYGSFAAIPLFLIWIYLSWLIFLLGAEISALVELRLWRPTLIGADRLLTHYEEELVKLAIATTLVKGMLEDRAAVSVEEMSNSLQIAEPALVKILNEFVAVGLAEPIRAEERVVSKYILAKNPNTLRISDVILTDYSREPHAILQAYNPILDTFDDALSSSPANRLIRDFI